MHTVSSCSLLDLFVYFHASDVILFVYACLVCLYSVKYTLTRVCLYCVNFILVEGCFMLHRSLHCVNCILLEGCLQAVHLERCACTVLITHCGGLHTSRQRDACMVWIVHWWRGACKMHTCWLVLAWCELNTCCSVHTQWQSTPNRLCMFNTLNKVWNVQHTYKCVPCTQ